MGNPLDSLVNCFAESTIHHTCVWDHSSPRRICGPWGVSGFSWIFCQKHMLFGKASRDSGNFCHHGNGAAFSLVADKATVRSSLPVLLGRFFSELDPSCWGGTILSASWWHDSSTSQIVLVCVTTAKWNISCSVRCSSVRSSPSLLSKRSTVDRSSSCALLFGFSYNHDKASALWFCDPGMLMNFRWYLESHCDQHI